MMGKVGQVGQRFVLKRVFCGLPGVYLSDLAPPARPGAGGVLYVPRERDKLDEL